MPTPTTGDTVTIDYVLRRGDGEEVGTTAGIGPQRIVLGSGAIFLAIEAALMDMAVGETRTVAIPCAEAFGPRNATRVMEIPRTDLPPGPEPEPGMTLQAQRADGSPLRMHVVEVGADSVTVDANHPLAGEDLTFDLTLRGHEPATRGR